MSKNLEGGDTSGRTATDSQREAQRNVCAAEVRGREEGGGTRKGPVEGTFNKRGGLLPPSFPDKISVCALFSKSDEAKRAAALSAAKVLSAAGKIDSVAWFAPKKKMESLSFVLGVPLHVFDYESLQKNNKPFDVVNEKTLMIVENSARYKSINTFVFSRMARISLQAKHKVLLDVVPFRADVENIYMPFSYLGREILGHQHWYAFRESYFEYDRNGKLVEGLENEILAQKIAPYTVIDYETFFDSWEFVPFELSEVEKDNYQEHRDWAFSQEDVSGSVIVTYLADFAHTMPTRYEALKEALREGEGKRVLVYTNIKKHNKAIEKIAPGATVRTFYDSNGDEGDFDDIILFEAPIVRGYLFLDALAYARCPVKVFPPQTTVEKLLWGRLKKEVDTINEFARVLKKEVAAYGA